MVHHYEIDLHRKCAGLAEALRIVPYEKPFEVHLAGVGILGQYGLYVHNGKLGDEVLPGILEYLAYRATRTAHKPFHAIGRAYEMAFVDAFAATYAHENVLGVVGHSHDFVGHYLAYGKYEVEGRVQQQFVDLCRPVVMELALGDFFDVGSGYAAHGHYVVAPVVHAEQLLGSVAEHSLDLLVSHSSMRAQGRHNVGQGGSEIVIHHLGYRTCVGVEPGEVRRYGQHPAARPHGIEDLFQRRTHLVGRDRVGLGAPAVV